jgi:hypothetical protein
MIPFSPLVSLFHFDLYNAYITVTDNIIDFMINSVVYVSNLLFYSFIIAITTNNIDYFIHSLSQVFEASCPFANFLVDVFISFSISSLLFSYLYMLWNYIVSIWNIKSEKRLIIVRGVPGVGKHSYVSWRELNDEYRGQYALCEWSKLFEKWNNETEVFEYDYDPLRVREADHQLLSRAVRAFRKQINRIYVAHTFEKRWSYEPYVLLAESNGYTVEIVELVCKNKRELRHFNHRSVRNVPFKKSIRVFAQWQKDKRALLQEPYLEAELGENGDSIPLHLSSAKEREEYSQRLDAELENYFNNHPNNRPSVSDIDRRIYNQLNISSVLIPRITSKDMWFARKRVDMTF